MSQSFSKYRSVCHTNCITLIYLMLLYYVVILCVLSVTIEMLFHCMPRQLPMGVCLLLILVSRALAILTKVVAYPGGLNGLHHSVKNPYSGTNYGLTVAAQRLGPSLIV